MVALSFFIPLLIGTGGNIGSQTVTLIVRAMALGEVTLRDIGWIVFKELRVGLIMGGVMAVVGFALAGLLGVGSDIGLVVALTIVAICVWSATVAAVAAAGPAPARRRPGGRLGAADHDPGRRHRPDHLLRDRAPRPRPVALMRQIGGTTARQAATAVEFLSARSRRLRRRLPVAAGNALVFAWFWFGLPLVRGVGRGVPREG